MPGPSFYNTTGPYLPATTVLPSLAAVTAFDDTKLDDGTVVAVATLLDDFELKKTSVTAADGITVVATASGTGRWHRRLSPSIYWLYQATWHIDQATGNDENDGLTAGTAVASNDEIVRRIAKRPPRVAVDIYLHGSYTGRLAWDSAYCRWPLVMTYHGERTSLYSRVFDGATPYNAAGGVAGSMACSFLPVSWTASGLVGKLVVIESGAHAGYVGWVAKDLGAKTARYSPFIETSTFNLCDPAINDNFSVYDLTHVLGGIYIRGPMSVDVYDCYLDGGGSYNIACQVEDWATLQTFSCLIDNGLVMCIGPSYLSMLGCRVGPGIYGTLRTRFTGIINVDACEIECASRSEPHSPIEFWSNSILQYTTVPIGLYGDVQVKPGYWLGGFDAPAASVGLTVRERECATLFGLFWGIGSIGNYGIECGAGGLVRYQTLPTYGPNAVNDVLVGGVAAAYGGLPLVTAIQAAGIVVYS